MTQDQKVEYVIVAAILGITLLKIWTAQLHPRMISLSLYVSSIGGTVGGAMLFGTLGAMTGGRAKKKTVKNETHHYLIITYQSPDVKCIGFEICLSLSSAYRFVDDFKQTASDTTVAL